MTGDTATPTDEELMERVAHTGDAIAFEHLLERHELRARRLAMRYLGRQADADDAAQEAFARMWRYRQTYKRGNTFSPWLSAIVVRAAFDLSRRRPPAETLEEMPEQASRGASPREAAAHAERRDRLADAIAVLPPRQRLALSLVYEDNMRTADAAEAMGLKLKALEGLLSRARTTLRERLLPQEKEA